MIRDDAFEKLYGCENEETAETGAVDWLRLSRYFDGKVCHLHLISAQLILSKDMLILKGGVLWGKCIHQGRCSMVRVYKKQPIIF